MMEDDNTFEMELDEPVGAVEEVNASSHPHSSSLWYQEGTVNEQNVPAGAFYCSCCV